MEEINKYDRSQHRLDIRIGITPQHPAQKKSDTRNEELQSNEAASATISPRRTRSVVCKGKLGANKKPIVGEPTTKSKQKNINPLKTASSEARKFDYNAVKRDAKESVTHQE